jgi:hypothetical protein
MNRIESQTKEHTMFKTLAALLLTATAAQAGVVNIASQTPINSDLGALHLCPTVASNVGGSWTGKYESGTIASCEVYIANAAPTPKPTPKPTPQPVFIALTDDQAQQLYPAVAGKYASRQQVKQLQAWVGTYVDGVWGPKSDAAYNAKLSEVNAAAQAARIEEIKKSRRFITKSDFALAYGDANSVDVFYSKLVSELKARGYNRARIIDVQIDHSPRDWRFNHTIVLSNKNEIIKAVSDTHMFRWNRIQSIDFTNRSSTKKGG